MIHTFDGFHWASESTDPVWTDRLSNTITPSTISQGCNLRAGAGVFSLHSAQGNVASVIARPQILNPAGAPKLVAGARVSFGSGSRLNFLLVPHSIAMVLTATRAAWLNTVPKSGATTLPSFIVETTTTEIWLMTTTRTSGDNYLSYTTDKVSLPGLNASLENMYEVVYDFQNDKIELWVNDVMVYSYAYTFTQGQKDARYYVHPCMQAASDGRVFTHCYYVADTRLGPVKTIGKKATADVEISPVFGTGPHFQKTGESNTPAEPNRIKTKSSGQAVFEYAGGIPADATVLAVVETSRTSTTHKSARETECKVSFKVRQGSQEFAQTPSNIPTNSNMILSNVLELNPITGVAWTADELNALQAGYSLEIYDKFTVAE